MSICTFCDGCTCQIVPFVESAHVDLYFCDGCSCQLVAFAMDMSTCTFCDGCTCHHVPFAMATCQLVPFVTGAHVNL